jgi:UDP-N-acetylmuramoyl-tripeptide--D-alanyl-D-alanine ligase
MSYVMQLSEIAKVIGGNLQHGDCHFDHISTDTRKVSAGDVFLALQGENFDAHDFCQQAINNGAVALIVERDLSLDVPQLIVPSCHLALGDIGRINRNYYQGPLIGVTGSNGKTTTKEIIASILAIKGNTLATFGNLNNEIGVPQTLLRLNGKQQYCVVEMGANAVGEIAYCTGLAQPDVAIITNAMGAHLEGFGSLQGVVQAKGEIFQGLSAEGTAILNLDDDNVGQWQKLLVDKNCLTFSLHDTQADVYASAIKQLPGGSYQFTLHFEAQSSLVKMQLLALHNVQNALAAAASTFAIGFSMQEIVTGLQNATAIGGRLKALVGLNSATVIDDSYNGNPDSVKAGLDLLAQLPGQRILALGDMAELGVDELKMHKSIGTYAAEKNIDFVFSCGPKGALAAQEFAKLTTTDSCNFMNKDQMIEKLKTMMNQNSKILVKGSLSAGMKQVVTELTEEVSR